MCKYNMIDSEIKQRKEFLEWIKKTISDRYRNNYETPDCVSPIRDFVPLKQTTFTEKSLDLFLSNKQMGKSIYHIFKSDCDRCLRIMSASSIFHSRKNPEIFTPVAKEIIELENKEREIEKLKEDYKGDGIYLIRIESPYIGKDTTLHETHLVFYDKISIRQGISKIKERIYNSNNKNIFQLTDFSEPILLNFEKNLKDYYLTYSQDFFKEHKGHKNTRLEIIAKKIK